MNRSEPARRLLYSISLCLAIVHAGNVAKACSCIQRAPCNPHRYGDADFAGEVLSRMTVSADGHLTSYLFGARNNVYRIRVIESFRGGQRAGDVIDVQTGLGGGDCGYRFEIGHKYLVDGWNREGVLHTGICSVTAPIERSEEELRILRKIAARQPLPSLVGTVMRNSGPPDEIPLGPIANISLELKPLQGDQPFPGGTDNIGAFSFSHLPPGEYQISMSLPSNLSPAFTSIGRIESGRLPRIRIESYAETVCHADIVVEPSGGISGSVRLPSGQIDGWVNADTVTPSGSAWNTILSTTPSPDGKFSLEHLGPGRYQVQFTRREGFVKGEPQTIDIKDGEKRTGILLVAK